jgi:hypothetical protein
VGNISPHSPPPMPDLGVAGGGSLLGGARVGLSEGRKGGWGRRGWHGPRTLALLRQPAWRDSLVVLVHVALQAGPRQYRPGTPLARYTSVATLSRQRM